MTNEMIDRMTALEDIVRDMLHNFVPYHNEMRYRLLDKLNSLPSRMMPLSMQEVDEEEAVGVLCGNYTYCGPDKADKWQMTNAFRGMRTAGYRIIKDSNLPVLEKRENESGVADD